MSVNEKMVQDIVQEVVAKMQISSDVSGKKGVFSDMNEAIEASKKAQKIVARMSMDQREAIISNIRQKIKENAEILARMGVEETGMGNVGHKILKHQLVAEKTPGTEDITTTAWSGDRGLTLIEMGPFGVIGAITPCTNPSETVLCNTIGMLAGGNTVVFNPHPAAIKTSIYAVNLINEASVEVGGPDNIAVTVEHPTMETSDIMMIISNIRQKIKENAEILARMGVEETGMGNVGHKILKHQLVAEKTPGTEDITTTAWSGDRGLTLIEMGPFGVIGAITPCTNPSETVLCNTIGMLAGGNTVVFNPHPAAIKTSIYAVNLINEASVEVGGPDNIAVTVEHPTMETSDIMMKHKDIHLIAATGGPGVVTAVLSSGKRGIGAGAGNPPALVDETADIRKAAEDIVNGCTFDNNLPCIAEKEIVAVDSIADELLHYMVNEQGCYMISKEEQDALTEVVLKGGRLNRKCVGRDAKTLLGMIGITVPDNIRCITFEGPKEHPLIAEELMMPILGVVRAKDFDDAVEQAVWLEHGNRHSAHIHSKNVDNITKYAKAIDTAILVKNGPSYAALGFGGEGYCTFTIASRTGEGLTSASTFTKRRRCVMTDSLCIR